MSGACRELMHCRNPRHAILIFFSALRFVTPTQAALTLCNDGSCMFPCLFALSHTFSSCSFHMASAFVLTHVAVSHLFASSLHPIFVLPMHPSRSVRRIYESRAGVACAPHGDCLTSTQGDPSALVSGEDGPSVAPTSPRHPALSHHHHTHVMEGGGRREGEGRPTWGRGAVDVERRH